MKNRIQSGRPYAQICSAIDTYFADRGMKYTDVAKELGISPAAVSFQLSGKNPFGSRAAIKWATTFPFRTEFLLYGKGSLTPSVLYTLGSGTHPDAADLRFPFPQINEGNTPNDSVMNLSLVGRASGSFFIQTAINAILNNSPQSTINDLLSLIMIEHQMNDIAMDIASDETHKDRIEAKTVIIQEHASYLAKEQKRLSQKDSQGTDEKGENDREKQ